MYGLTMHNISPPRPLTTALVSAIKMVVLVVKSARDFVIPSVNSAKSAALNCVDTVVRVPVRSPWRVVVTVAAGSCSGYCWRWLDLFGSRKCCEVRRPGL